MATYSRHEVWSHRVEYTVPATFPLGACWAEVWKAIEAAHKDLVKAGLVDSLARAKDDQIRLITRDDSIVVVIELPTERGDE